MPGEDIHSWNVVAANNGTADTSIGWQEGQTRASVNNSARSMMAAHAKHRNLTNGTIVTGGSANAQTFTSGVGYIAPIPTGLRVLLKIGPSLTNTTAATLNMDGIGDTAIKTSDGLALKGGELVGGSYTELLYDGTSWIFLYSREFFFELITGGDGIVLGCQKFTAVGAFTYTPTEGMECCIIECIGGGGGGGGAYTPGGQGFQGGGGGGGSYSRKLATAADIGTSLLGTVGGGGGTGGPGQNGWEGAATSLGSLCIANGGAGGSAAWNSASPYGGSGGAAGTGDVVIPGTPGGTGAWGGGAFDGNWVLPGNGGSGPFGGGGTTAGLGGAGGNGVGFGAGGGGGSVYSGASASAGGLGAAGAVIITEFGGRGAPGRDGAPGAVGPIGPDGPAGPGTGDVLVSGTPAFGQVAQWTDTSHIKGVDLATILPTPPSAFRTGDAKITLNGAAEAGWVFMDDGTIGSATSGASNRANADTQALFTVLFTFVDDTWAPIFTSAGAATTRVAQGNAAAAWAANCRMSLTKVLGRSLAVAGAGGGLTYRPLGSTVGAETETPTVAKTAYHDHPPPVFGVYTLTDTGQDVQSFPGPWYRGTNYTSVTNLPSGGSAPLNIMQPTTFWLIMVKL